MLLNLTAPGAALTRHDSASSAASRDLVSRLLAKRGRQGQGSVRGPLVEGPFPPGDRPLAGLKDGEKLHIFADGARDRVGGLSASELLDHLATLGLSPDVRLKQIHLIADLSGVGGDGSFAHKFAEALAVRGYRVEEIKAPRGLVSAEETGKILIRPVQSIDEAVLDAGDGWLPSSKALNEYAGPNIQEKHR
jgi:hypothetical protein